MSNLDLWNSVEKTDPNHTKAITGKSYQGTSPKPHYLVHKATDTFGPIGIGWGFSIVSERIEEGAGGEKMHFAHVRVWFKWNGERGEVEHVGGTQFSGTRSSGKPFTDEDAPKKSVTDALVKALSMIGFAGDIFMGRYDDSKYVNEVRAEIAATEKAADAPKGPTVAVLKENYKRLKAELLEQQSQGWRVMAKWLNDASVLSEIDALGRYAEDFKVEARDIFDLAKKGEEEFGKVLPVEARGDGYVEPSFEGLGSSK